jgi:predicted nucleotidyltransferase
MPAMRLDPSEIQAIRQAAQAVFGDCTNVRVFGSRVRDDLKGGDLDLYLEVEPGQATIENEMRFRALIERPLDELKLDIVLHERGRPHGPIDRIALRDGVLL